MPRPAVIGNDPNPLQPVRPTPQVDNDRLIEEGSDGQNGRPKIPVTTSKDKQHRISWLSKMRPKGHSSSTKEQPKREPEHKFLSPLYGFIKRLSRSENRDKPRRQTRSGKAIKWALLILIAFLVLGAIRGFRASSAVVAERSARTAEDTRIEEQFNQLGASSIFPLEDAVAKAQRLAYECFTVPNAGATADTGDFVALQNKALADAGIPVGNKVSCGWDGKGRGKVDAMQVVKDPYWITTDRATIILQIKLYQRPGFIYYYTPFTNSNGVAKYAGMPAIFGTASGAQNFMTVCKDPNESIDTEKLQQTAQLFLSALAGEGDLDLGYLTYKGAKFGSFSPTVSSPKVTQVKYCGATGDERRFAAMVRFKGPIQGATYTLPYAFSVVSNPGTGGRYQVKHFGPVPGYTGG